MKFDMNFQIELDGVGESSMWSIVFFKLYNGNVGIEIRNKGLVIACSEKGEETKDLRKMISALD